MSGRIKKNAFTTLDTASGGYYIKGFTLFELIVVLAIISALVTIVVPYANRSNDTLKIKQHALNLVETIKYGIDSAVNTHNPVMLTIDTKNKTYQLRKVGANGEPEYKNPGKWGYAMPRKLGRQTRISEIKGFSPKGRKWNLTFEPGKQWPKASFAISNTELLVKIKINCKSVTIEQITI